MGVGAAGAHFGLPIVWKELERAMLRRACARTRSVVLTYDDGPGDLVTGDLLDLLDGLGVRATFFLLGRSVAGREGLVGRIAGAHEVGSHSFDHTHAWRAGPGRTYRDIVRGHGVVSGAVGGSGCGLFRPAYGKASGATWLASRRIGARVCWWTIDSGDTRASVPAAGSCASRVTPAGGVVLMHDGHREGARARFVLEETRRVVERARELGLGVRMMGELLDRAVDCADCDAHAGAQTASRASLSDPCGLVGGRSLGAVASASSCVGGRGRGVRDG